MVMKQHYIHQCISNYTLVYWRHIVVALSFTSVLLTIFRIRTSERPLPVDLANSYNQVRIKPSIINDPYLHPGTLTTRNGTNNAVVPFWDPFDPSLPRPPPLLQIINERQPQPWLQNKTLLLIGDSVDRYVTQYFCELTDSDYRRLSMTDLDFTNEPDDLRVKTSPVVCRFDYYDFEIISFSHYGLQNDSEEFWEFRPGYTKPGLIENRVPLLAPLLQKHNRQPDMIIMGSGIFDIYPKLT